MSRPIGKTCQVVGAVHKPAATKPVATGLMARLSVPIPKHSHSVLQPSRLEVVSDGTTFVAGLLGKLAQP